MEIKFIFIPWIVHGMSVESFEKVHGNHKIQQFHGFMHGKSMEKSCNLAVFSAKIKRSWTSVDSMDSMWICVDTWNPYGKGGGVISPQCIKDHSMHRIKYHM
ncbi:hypothetical protein GALMADRAFT_774779 [Galerina marginata CBS 339.88]|uniref:Uncharacterized protein n=1 Tax=Galerina marginata (strain CBS 339.88) TaxID=685588 RepID=A0A067SPY1_GALM3|nr:hypothetical protein GALMADRAFT_774779 [Galerina marginata CBS 339.88]